MIVRTVVDVEELARAAAVRLDAAVLRGDQALAAARSWAAIEAIAAAAKARCAARVADTNSWDHDTDRTAADWLARETGTTSAAARAAIAVGSQLETLGSVRAAAARGELSPVQVEAIAPAATADPSREAELVGDAGRLSVRELRDKCADIRAKADPDPAATAERIHRERSLRRWTAPDGSARLSIKGPKADLAAFDSVLRPLQERTFRQHRTSGEHEDPQTYAYDAFIELITQPRGDRKRVDPKYLTLVRVDYEALVRGSVDSGETCDIPGIGPIDALTARSLLGDSILKLVITRGADVATTVHLGRGPNAAQKLALQWLMPECTNQGCPCRWHLQHDHRTPWADNQITVLTNIDPLCGIDHWRKTVLGWELVDGKGKRPLVPPDDPRHPKNKPKTTDPPADESPAA